MKKILLSFLWVLIMLGSQAYAQNRTITGTVIGKDDGLPIPGVSVLVKGTKLGTQTGGDGKYKITIPGETTVLTFSFVGYAVKDVATTASNTLNIVLDVNSKLLNEVVVTTSFGIQRDKKSLGYGATVVSNDDLTEGRTTNITNALAAKVSGVQVSGSGGAFTGSSVIIRGFTTFTGSNQPLYVVDGIPIDNGGPTGGPTALQTGATVSNRGSDINEDDIENVTVLKGAAATVLYGSRAASGAILITTKKGNKTAKNNIDFTTSYGNGVVDRFPKYQNTYAQGTLGNYNPGLNTSWGPTIAGQQVTNAFGNTETLTAYPNNVKSIFQHSNSLQNNISFTGGGEKTTFRVSYGNDYETYLIKNNVLKRNNLSFNGRTEITSKFRIGTSFSYVNSQSTRTVQGNNLSNPLFRGWFLPRSYDLAGQPYQDANGNQLYFGAEDNPLWSINHNLYHDQVNRVLGNINATYDLTSWLTADLRLGTDSYNQKSNGFDEIGNKGGGFNASNVGVGGVQELQYNFRSIEEIFTLTAQKRFGDFNFSGTLGNEITQVGNNFDQVYGFALVIPGFNNLKNTLTYQPSNGSTTTRLLGYYADVAVDYKKFFTLNVKARNDYSSTLLKANRSIFYPAVAGSFVMTEAFPELKTKNVNLIKFRANVGKVGKSPGAYNTDSYFVKGGATDGFGPVVNFPFPSTLGSLAGYELADNAGNPNLKPEFTTEIELGGEFAFFNNRLTFDGSVYRKRTTNVLLSVPVSPSSGVSSLFLNAGQLTTKGIELSLGITPLKTRNFSYTINTTFTSFKSVVDALAPGVPNIFLGGFTTPQIRLVAGQEYGQIYGTDYQRDANGNVLIQSTGANAGLPVGPTPDLKNIGNPNPKWIMGINNNITFKGIYIGALLDIRHGGVQYARNIADLQRNGAAAETAEFPRFNSDGTIATPYTFTGVYANGQPNTTAISAQSYYGNSGKYVAAAGYIYDTSWFRIREANIGYTFPKSMLAHTPFGRASIGAFARNLYFNAPHYPHFDPEQNALGVSNAQGLEFNSLPNTRTIGVNLKVSL